MNRMPAITPPPPLNSRLWLRRHFVAFVIIFAALVTIADGSLPRAETHRIEEPCGIALIGACLPRKVVAWERTQGAVVEATQGFTLIELSIVLAVIGLIVGGVLVGQIMIKQAETQAQISQIGKYDAAVNTFRNKYNAIPGDILYTSAIQFGFPTDGSCTGQVGGRDGNGLIDAWPYAGGNQLFGETSLFWQDLSVAGFIDGVFPGGGAAPITCNAPGVAFTTTPGTTFLGDYMPLGKIGGGNFITVYEYNGINWFALEAITSTNTNGRISFGPTTMSVTQAYNIDKKIDDGLPATGTVQAEGSGINNNGPAPVNAQSSDSSTSCYNTTTNTYSTNVSNGSNPNCALSFKMQGAAR